MAQPYFYISNNETQFLSHDVCRAKDWGEFRIVTLLYEYANHILRQGAKPCSSMPKETLFRRCRKNEWVGFVKEKAFERNEERRGGRESVCEGRKGRGKHGGVPPSSKKFPRPSS